MSRESFERHIREAALAGGRAQPRLERDAGGAYVDGNVQAHWRTWCAARAADAKLDQPCGNDTEHPAELALRSLAAWLGVGGYNAARVDAKVFEAKIRWAFENLQQTRPLDAEWTATDRHRKGGFYMRTALGTLQTDAPLEDGAKLWAYVGEDGRWWFRAPAEFGDGRFTQLAPAQRPHLSGTPVARLHVKATDSYPSVDVEVLDGAQLQPSMSPVDVYTRSSPDAPA